MRHLKNPQLHFGEVNIADIHIEWQNGHGTGGRMYVDQVAEWRGIRNRGLLPEFSGWH